VRYLPFAYDDGLFNTSPSGAPSYEVLFVGGADRDRVAFMTEFMREGLRPALVGGYWGSFSETRAYNLGIKGVDTIRQLTVAAAVNLCLVRRANRDGHVMRSFEIPAIGGFMLAEETPEHREIFGAEGRCALYFKTPGEAAAKARWALANAEERYRMAYAARAMIISRRNTWADRLVQILAALTEGSNHSSMRGDATLTSSVRPTGITCSRSGIVTPTEHSGFMALNEKSFELPAHRIPRQRRDVDG
jgi:spore maturation protein CgeB